MKKSIVAFIILFLSSSGFSSELNSPTHIMTVQCNGNAGNENLQQARVQLIWNGDTLVSATLSSKFETAKKITAVYSVIPQSTVMGQDVTVVPEVRETSQLLYGYFNEPATGVKFDSVGGTRIYSLAWGGDKSGSAKIIYQRANPSTADIYWSVNGVATHIPAQTCALDFN